MKIFPELIWVIVAVIGGASREISMYLKDNNHTFSIQRIVARMVVGGFSGYMFGQFVLTFNSDWALIAAGVGGWMGADAIDFVWDIIRKSFKANVK